MQNMTAIQFGYYRSEILKRFCLMLLQVIMANPVATAQPTHHEISFTEKPNRVFIDRAGELYVQFGTRLVRFQPNGKTTGSWQLPADTLLFEPRDGSRMFVFHPKNKTWGFVTFGNNPNAQLPAEYAVEPLLACSAGDQGMWILDASDYSMKRVNLKKGLVETEFYLPENLHGTHICHLREYQGFLFAATASHIYVFSPFGKLLKTHQADGCDFDFLGEELYYRKDNQLVFVDLFDGTLRYEAVSPDARFIRLTDEVRYIVFPDHLVILAVQ